MKLDIENMKRFELKNDYSICCYYVYLGNLIQPIYYYYEGENINYVIRNSKQTFFDEFKFHFNSLDKSTFEHIFEGQIKKLKI